MRNGIRRRSSNIRDSKKFKSISQNSSQILHVTSFWFWLLIFALLYGLGFIYFMFTFENNNLKHNHHPRNTIDKPLLITDDSHDDTNKEAYIIPSQEPFIAMNEFKLDASIKAERYLDNNKSLPINEDFVVGKYIPLAKPWGYKYRCRIMCLIITMWPLRKTKMDIISETFGQKGRGCYTLSFVIDLKNDDAPDEYRGHKLLKMNLTRLQNNSKKERNIWEKVHTMWSYIYNNKELLYEHDWFIKADDDTFIISENMRGFLQYHDPNFPHYMGHSIRSRWERENVIFNSGVCYALSRKTLIKIGPYISHLPTLQHQTGRSHCIDRKGAGEDPTTGICLLGVGIRPTNTLDHEMRERFLIFRDTDHVKIIREDTWYWKYKPPNVKVGKDCCSPYIVSVHNYKKDADALKHYPLLMKQYNSIKDWDNIPLPPRPRYFLYDKNQVKFNIDEHLNVDNPPKGQRIMKGNKEWICNKCKIGDRKDPYWTEWWDKDMLNGSNIKQTMYNGP